MVVIRCLVMSALLHSTSAASNTASAPDWEKVAEHVLPAIVKVEVAGEKPAATLDSAFFERFVGKSRPHTATGSGFVIGADGHVLTAAATFEHADRIFVTLHSGVRHPARLIGRDDLLDIALLKIDGVSNLPFLQ